VLLSSQIRLSRRQHEVGRHGPGGQTTVDGRALAEQLGRVGLWTRQLDVQPAKQVREAIAELEELGWGSLWFWEVFGREALTSAGLLLCATRRMVIASGIANIWARPGRDGRRVSGPGRGLVEAYPGRFVSASASATARSSMPEAIPTSNHWRRCAGETGSPEWVKTAHPSGWIMVAPSSEEG
jgi:hypothetical protein